MSGGGFDLGKFFDGPYPLDYLSCAQREIPNKPTSLYGMTIQSGIISIFHGGQEQALENWEKQIRKGHIKKVHDHNINVTALEIAGLNISTVYITIPAGIFQTLGIRLPYLVLVVKNLRKPFMFDILIKDDKNLRRRFRFHNNISTCRIKPNLAIVPLALDDGWNEIKINLPDLVQRSYGGNFKETIRIQIYGTCRLRRVLFSEKSGPEDGTYTDRLPADVKAFFSTLSRENSKARSIPRLP